MNNKVVIALVFILLYSYSAGNAQSENTPTIAEHYETKKFNAAIFPASSREVFSGSERFTPSKQEIEIAEQALIKQLAAINADRQNQDATPIIDKNLSKYKRQYFGYTNDKGNKILFINCFWKRNKEDEKLWLNERIMVLDGGSYFWNIKFNLTTNELFDLDVNGNL
jgi:hypothetical protein